MKFLLVLVATLGFLIAVSDAFWFRSAKGDKNLQLKKNHHGDNGHHGHGQGGHGHGQGGHGQGQGGHGHCGHGHGSDENSSEGSHEHGKIV